MRSTVLLFNIILFSCQPSRTYPHKHSCHSLWHQFVFHLDNINTMSSRWGGIRLISASLSSSRYFQSGVDRVCDKVLKRLLGVLMMVVKSNIVNQSEQFHGEKHYTTSWIIFKLFSPIWISLGCNSCSFNKMRDLKTWLMDWKPSLTGVHWLRKEQEKFCYMSNSFMICRQTHRMHSFWKFLSFFFLH